MISAVQKDVGKKEGIRINRERVRTLKVRMRQRKKNSDKDYCRMISALQIDATKKGGYKD